MFCICFGFSLFGESPETVVEQWYRTQPQSSRYASIKADLTECFSDLHENDIPADILMERLNEGTAKRVRPVLLLKALRSDTERLIEAREIIADLALSSVSLNLYTEMLKQLGVFLRGGLTRDTIEAIIQDTVHDRFDWESVSQVLFFLQRLESIRPLKQGEYIKLGTGLITFGFTAEVLDTLASLYLMAGTKGISSELFLDMTLQALERNENVMGISREIERRARR